MSFQSDLDSRGISPRDIICGDVLTLVSYDGKKRRRVNFGEYLSGEFPNRFRRREMGWVSRSLDGDPPHAEILRSLLAAKAKAERKAANLIEEKKKRAARALRRKLRKAALA